MNAVTSLTTSSGLVTGLTIEEIPESDVGESEHAILSGPFALTDTGVFEDTGLFVTLPEARSYLITYNVHGKLEKSDADAWISARLFNVTAGAAVEASARLVIFKHDTDDSLGRSESGFSHLITVAVVTVIRLECSRNSTGSPTWVTSDVASDSLGVTTLGYLPIAPLVSGSGGGGIDLLSPSTGGPIDDP
jgi:hypothetical protein